MNPNTADEGKAGHLFIFTGRTNTRGLFRPANNEVNMSRKAVWILDLYFGLIFKHICKTAKSILIMEELIICCAGVDPVNRPEHGTKQRNYLLKKKKKKSIQIENTSITMYLS